MKRRTFIKSSSLTALSIGAFGAIQWNGRSFVGNSPTTTDILGPFYRPGAPLRSNLIPPGSKGMPINLNGIVYKDDGVSRLSNALVEIWHCSEDAVYDNASDDYLFRGGQMTGKDGKYEFKTIFPVPYKAAPDDEQSWRPAHIHMRISSPEQQDLITQIYFENDPYLSMDSSSSSPESASRILELGKNKKGETVVAFDVVMRKTFPLDASVYKRISGLYELPDIGMIEFYPKDDLLFVKRNGQIGAGLNYIGNNTFVGGMGYPKATFELKEGGSVKVAFTIRRTTVTGEKFLKYNE